MVRKLQSLRWRSHVGNAAITYALWQRTLALVQFHVLKVTRCVHGSDVKTFRYVPQVAFSVIPDEVNSYLESVTDGHTQWARDLAAESTSFLAGLGVASNSTVAQLYTRSGWAFRTRTARYELLAPSEIAEWTAYAHDELDVPNNFLALTSNEGQGFFLMDRNGGSVYDVEYGQFDLLENGKLEPLASSFAEFILWYVSDEQGDGT